jgi:hypothetical protein
VDRDVEGLNEAANGGTIFKCQQFDVTARLRLKVLGQIDGLMFSTANVRQRANDNQTFRSSISTYWDIRSPAVIPDYSQYPLRIGGRLLNWPLSTAFCDCPASSKEVHPVGEGKRPFFEASFNRSVKVQGGHDRLTSDGGAILLREADHRLGLIDSLAQQLSDPRNQNLIRYRISELLRERIYGLALGYRAQDDLDRLAHDPAMRMATWDRPGQQVLTERLASQPTQSRLLDVVAHVGNNLEVVRRALADWVQRHLRTRSDHAVRRGTIDIDSFPLEVYGDQAYPEKVPNTNGTVERERQYKAFGRAGLRRAGRKGGAAALGADTLPRRPASSVVNCPAS